MAELYHLGVDVQAVTSHVLLVGPGFDLAESLASFGAVPVASRREYSSWLVDRSGHRLLILRVGVGAPPLAIALEELSRAGARVAILVGTARGTPAPESVLVPTGAVREDGTSDQYAPMAFPAVPDPPLRASLARRSGDHAMPGLVRSVDVLPPEAEHHRLVVATDLLCGCLFVVASARHMRACAALVHPAADPATSTAVAEAALATLSSDRSQDDGEQGHDPSR